VELQFHINSTGTSMSERVGNNVLINNTINLVWNWPISENSPIDIGISYVIERRTKLVKRSESESCNPRPCNY
jgi:hypothetical protein